MNIKRKIYIYIILFILLLECRAIAGYIEKINLKVSGQIAKPIFIVNHEEEIKGNYSNINEVPEYTFEIKNCNENNEISQMDFNVIIEVSTENQVEFEVVNCSTNEIVLNNKKKNSNLILEKYKPSLNKYKVTIKSDKVIAKDMLKIYIDAKYYKYELDVFDINLDNRSLEYEIYTSEPEKKYTNKDIIFQIKCNKEIKSISGFELSEDKTCLSKRYSENINENITIEDFFNNKKNIKITVNNIDKILPEIVGIEEGNEYNKGLKLVYKDNIGIKNIRIENKTKKQSYNASFDEERQIIDSQILVVKGNSINPYYLNQEGDYTIIVTDFAENQLVRHISIK